VFLEGEPAVGTEEARAHGLIRHGYHAVARAEGASQMRRDLAQRRALGEEPRAMEMRGEIAVTEIEPCRLAEADHLAERATALIAQAPAATLVDEPGQGIADRVEVGGDVQPPDQRVVARVADDGEHARFNQRIQASQELGGAGATGEGDEAHDPELAEGGRGSPIAAPPHRAPQGAAPAPAEETDPRAAFQLLGQLGFRDGNEAEADPYTIETLRPREDRLDLLTLGPGESEGDEAGRGIHCGFGIRPRRARHRRPVQHHRPSHALQHDGAHQRTLAPRAPACYDVVGGLHPTPTEGEERARLTSRLPERSEREAFPGLTSFQAPRPSDSWPDGTSPRAWPGS